MKKIYECLKQKINGTKKIKKILKKMLTKIGNIFLVILFDTIWVGIIFYGVMTATTLR